MERKIKESNRVHAGAGYVLGLIFGFAIMAGVIFGLGATFFGILLGLSFSLSIGIAFECSFAGSKQLPLFQKVLLSISTALLLLSVLSLFLWEEMYLF